MATVKLKSAAKRRDELARPAVGFDFREEREIQTVEAACEPPRLVRRELPPPLPVEELHPMIVTLEVAVVGVFEPDMLLGKGASVVRDRELDPVVRTPNEAHTVRNLPVASVDFAKIEDELVHGEE